MDGEGGSEGVGDNDDSYIDAKCYCEENIFVVVNISSGLFIV